jgi:hypothetical protein
MAKQSRYDDVKRFEPDPLGRATFKGLLPRPVTRARSVIEHTIVAGERSDRLALNYFNDDRHWWRILDANVGFVCATDMVLELSDAEQASDPFGRVDMTGRTVLVPPKEG